MNTPLGRQAIRRVEPAPLEVPVTERIGYVTSRPRAGWPLVIRRLDGTVMRTSDVRLVTLQGRLAIVVTKNSRYVCDDNGVVYRAT